MSSFSFDAPSSRYDCVVTVIIGVTIALLPIAQFPNIAPPKIWLQANYPVPTQRSRGSLSLRQSNSK